MWQACKLHRDFIGITYLHVLFTHLHISQIRHTHTQNIHKWNLHSTWLCASTSSLVSTHWHDKLAMSKNTHTLTPCSTHHIRTCSPTNMSLCIPLTFTPPLIASTHTCVHYTSTFKSIKIMWSLKHNGWQRWIE